VAFALAQQWVAFSAAIKAKLIAADRSPEKSKSQPS